MDDYLKGVILSGFFLIMSAWISGKAMRSGKSKEEDRVDAASATVDLLARKDRELAEKDDKIRRLEDQSHRPRRRPGR